MPATPPPTPAVAAIATPDNAPAPAERPAPPGPPAPTPQQVAELRGEVRKALGIARKRQIERLRAYRTAGRFPRGKSLWAEQIGHRTLREPLFVDESGTPCAVGYLMQRAGWTTEVAAIAAATPGVHVEEVTSGPIVDWVLRSGLTQDEATLIQPDYTVMVAKARRQAAAERKRLVRHFLAVEKQLISNTEVSLDIATVRLLPVILSGATLAELDDRRPQTGS